LRSRSPILTERGFDRRLAFMVAFALVLHFVVVVVLFFVANLKLRPDAPIDAYTVEVVDGGELGGHLPSGLPDVKIGPAAGPVRPPRSVAPAPEPAKPAPEPVKEEPRPPEPPVKPEPPAPAAEKPPEPAPQLAQEEPRPDVVIPDKTAPTPPAVMASAAPPPAPTPAPTRSVAAPTPRPAPSAPPATPRPAPSARITPAPEKPKATPMPRKSEMAIARRDGESAKPAARATPPARSAPAATPPSRDARIAEALARVQQRVGGDAGEQKPAVASARGPAAGGGVGGPDAPDASRRVGIGPGAGGAGKVRGVEFLLYYNQMLSRIRGAWVWTGGGSDLEVKVRFRILEDGNVVDVRITQASSDSSYDASVLRAIRGVSPLDPPPARYRDDFSDVELTFHPSDLKTAG
jgi:TonB family protein